MIDDGRPTMRELLTDTLREQLREIGVDKKIDPVDVWDLEYIEEEFDRYRFAHHHPVDYYEDVLASARKHKVWDEWLADALDAPQLICTECINHAYGMCAPHAVEARAYGSDE